MKEPKTPRTAGTLKAFVKVSKTGTDHTTPTKGTPTKITTRSRSATLSAQQAREQTTPTPASRKRKLTVCEAKPPEPVAAVTPTRKKQNTSLHAYFPKTPTKQVELPEPVIRGVKKPEEEPEAEKEEEKPKEETRSERAHRLLERLRARRSTTTQEDTRKIQEALRDRRHQTASAAEQASFSLAAKFAASKTPTNEDLAQQDIARQFVFNQAGKPTPLPRSLRKLESLFQALEHSVMFGGLTADGVIYHRIRRSVESMAKHTFGWRELGQILALYPESYSIKPAHVTHLGMSEILSVVLTPKSSGVQLAVEMEERRLEFRQKLVDLVKTAHTRFLEDRGYTQADIEQIEHGSWHPSFDLETTPAVEPLKLPLNPVDHQKSAKFDKSRLKHLLGKVGSSLSRKTAKAAPSALPLPTPTDSPVLKPTTTPAVELPSPAATKSTSSNVGKAKSLLDRIREKQRAKEEAKAAAAKQKKDGGLASSSTYARLPGILEFLSFLFYSERKSVLLFFYVVDKLVNSKHLDKAEAIGHLLDLTSLVPEWCTILDDDGKKDTKKQEKELPEKRKAADEPSAKALLKVIREISMQEAKNRLVSKISSLTK